MRAQLLARTAAQPASKAEQYAGGGLSCHREARQALQAIDEALECLTEARRRLVPLLSKGVEL